MLNIFAVFVFLLAGWFFFNLILLLRPSLEEAGAIPGMSLPQLLVAFLLTLVLHELIHGLSFSILTGEHPKYGFRGFFFYAAAPDWYIPRNTYLRITLAPLALLSLLGMGVLLTAPVTLVPIILFTLAVNAAGATSDLFVATWLWRAPPTVLINDAGSNFTMYGIPPKEKPAQVQAEL